MSTTLRDQRFQPFSGEAFIVGRDAIEPEQLAQHIQCSVVRANRWNRAKKKSNVYDNEASLLVPVERHDSKDASAITQCAVKRETLAPDVEEVARTPPPPRAPPVPPPPPPPLLTSEELASHWCNQAALFNKANGCVKGALTKTSLQKSVQEFGHLSERSPYGTKCLMAMTSRFHQQYLYRYQFTDPVRCGVFTTPYEFSKKASQEPLDVKDGQHFPTIYQQIGSGDYAYVVCLNLARRQPTIESPHEPHRRWWSLQNFVALHFWLYCAGLCCTRTTLAQAQPFSRIGSCPLSCP